MENKIKEGSIEKIIGVVIVVAVIVIAVVVKLSLNGGNSKLEKVYVATGGGKEDFIADTEVNKIINKKYKLDVVYDSWSNGKTVSAPLVRETVGQGNTSVAESDWSIDNQSCTKYDALFTSDERFYNYYKLRPTEQEAKRPELNCIKRDTPLLCSLIVKSRVKVFILYIFIVLSLEPVANLPSFKIVEQNTRSL